MRVKHWRQARQQWELEFFRSLLVKHRYRVSAVAEAAGMGRPWCEEKLKKLGLLKSKRVKNETTCIAITVA